MSKQIVGVLILTAVLISGLVCGEMACAATYTVNTVDVALLNQAITDANNNPGLDTVQITAAGVYSGDITWPTEEVIIESTVADVVIEKSAGTGQAFRCDPGGAGTSGRTDTFTFRGASDSAKLTLRQAAANAPVVNTGPDYLDDNHNVVLQNVIVEKPTSGTGSTNAFINFNNANAAQHQLVNVDFVGGATDNTTAIVVAGAGPYGAGMLMDGCDYSQAQIAAAPSLLVSWYDMDISACQINNGITLAGATNTVAIEDTTVVGPVYGTDLFDVVLEATNCTFESNGLAGLFYFEGNTDQLATTFTSCVFDASGTNETQKCFAPAGTVKNFAYEFQGCDFNWYSARCLDINGVTGSLVVNNCAFDGGADPSYWMDRPIRSEGIVDYQVTITNSTFNGFQGEGITLRGENSGLVGRTQLIEDCTATNYAGLAMQAYKAVETTIVVRRFVCGDGYDGGANFQQSYGSNITLEDCVFKSVAGKENVLRLRRLDDGRHCTVAINNCSISGNSDGPGIQFRSLSGATHDININNTSFDDLRYAMASNSDGFTQQEVYLDNCTVTNCEVMVYNSMNDSWDPPTSKYEISNSNITLDSSGSYGWLFLDNSGSVKVDLYDSVLNGGLLASLPGSLDRNDMTVGDCTVTTPAGLIPIYNDTANGPLSLSIWGSQINGPGGVDFMDVNGNGWIYLYCGGETLFDNYDSVVVFGAEWSHFEVPVDGVISFTNITGPAVEDSISNTRINVQGMLNFEAGAGTDVLCSAGSTKQNLILGATNCNFVADNCDFGAGMNLHGVACTASLQDVTVVGSISGNNLTDFALTANNSMFKSNGAGSSIVLANSNGVDASFDTCGWVASGTGETNKCFAPEGTVQNFAYDFQGCTFDWLSGRAVDVNGATGSIVINNCAFNGGTDPAYWINRPYRSEGVHNYNVTITNTTFDGFQGEGVTLRGENTAYAANSMTVQDCTFSNFTGIGMQAYKCYGTENVTIQNVDIDGADRSLNVQQSEGSTFNITGCNFNAAPGSEYVVRFRRLENGTPSTISMDGCTISGNTDGRGIVLRQIVGAASNWTIQNTTFDSLMYAVAANEDGFANQTVNMDNLTVTNSDFMLMNTLDGGATPNTFSISNSDITLNDSATTGFLLFDGNGSCTLEVNNSVVNGNLLATNPAATKVNSIALDGCVFTNQASQDAAVWLSNSNAGLTLVANQTDFIGAAKPFLLANSTLATDVTATFSTWVGYDDGIALTDGSIDLDQCDFVDMATVVLVAGAADVMVRDSNFVMYDSVLADNSGGTATVDVDYCYFADESGAAAVGANSREEDITALTDVYVSVTPGSADYLKVLAASIPATLNSSNTPVYAGAKGPGTPTLIRDWSLY